MLTILQLVFDCADIEQQQNDNRFTTCIEGNLAKFALAFVSIFFSVSTKVALDVGGKASLVGQVMRVRLE